MVPHWMSGALFLLLLTVAWALINNYLTRRIQSAFGRQSRRHRYLRYGIVLLSFNYIYGRILERTFGVSDWVAVLFHFGAYWVGCATITFCVFGLADLGRAGLALGPWSGRRAEVPFWQFATRPWSRRGMAGLLLVSVALCLYAVYGALGAPTVERYRMSVPASAGVTEPMRVALLSDLHLGHLGTSEQLSGALELVAAEEPDLVLIPGDLVDETSADVARGLALIGDLEARYGVFVSLGNHERYSGLDFFMRECARHGIGILRQSHLTLPNGAVLAGVDDLRVLREANLPLERAMELALADVPSEAFSILMFHRPVRVNEAFARGADLVVAGHTHGGQLPPFQILSPFANDFHLAGPYEYESGTLYVTSGAGFWGPPMRLFAPREIVIIDLVPE